MFGGTEKIVSPSGKQKIIVFALVISVFVFVLISAKYEAILDHTGTLLCTPKDKTEISNPANIPPGSRMNCVCPGSSKKEELKTNPPATTPPSVTTKSANALNVSILTSNSSSIPSTSLAKAPVNRPMDRSKYAVPNIAHFTWYSLKPKEILFHNLLSLLSAHRIMKADKIFFHCNFQPIGKYWDEARSKIPNLIIKIVDPPRKMFGVKLKARVNDATDSDADRLRIMQEFGGVYIDLDLLILRSLDPLRMFQTTLGYESGTLVCGGFIMSAPDAPFIYLWIDNMLNDYRVDKWAYISGWLPTKLLSRYNSTGIVHVEPTTIHHPTWSHLSQLIGPKYYDWSANYAIHLWYRLWARNEEWESWKIAPSPESIKTSNTTFGQIARFIYYGSSKML